MVSADQAAIEDRHKTAAKNRKVLIRFMIPFLRRHYPDQVLRVPELDLRPEGHPCAGH
jgi:hypothetical protein